MPSTGLQEVLQAPPEGLAWLQRRPACATLPEGVLSATMQYLDMRDVLACRLVCTAWNRAATGAVRHLDVPVKALIAGITQPQRQPHAGAAGTSGGRGYGGPGGGGSGGTCRGEGVDQVVAVALGDLHRSWPGAEAVTLSCLGAGRRLAAQELSLQLLANHLTHWRHLCELVLRDMPVAPAPPAPPRPSPGFLHATTAAAASTSRHARHAARGHGGFAAGTPGHSAAARRGAATSGSGASGEASHSGSQVSEATGGLWGLGCLSCCTGLTRLDVELVPERQSAAVAPGRQRLFMGSRLGQDRPGGTGQNSGSGGPQRQRQRHHPPAYLAAGQAAVLEGLSRLTSLRHLSIKLLDLPPALHAPPPPDDDDEEEEEEEEADFEPAAAPAAANMNAPAMAAAAGPSRRPAPTRRVDASQHAAAAASHYLLDLEEAGDLAADLEMEEEGEGESEERGSDPGEEDGFGEEEGAEGGAGGQVAEGFATLDLSLRAMDSLLEHLMEVDLEDGGGGDRRGSLLEAAEAMEAELAANVRKLEALLGMHGDQEEEEEGASEAQAGGKGAEKKVKREGQAKGRSAGGGAAGERRPGWPGYHRPDEGEQQREQGRPRQGQGRKGDAEEGTKGDAGEARAHASPDDEAVALAPSLEACPAGASSSQVATVASSRGHRQAAATFTEPPSRQDVHLDFETPPPPEKEAGNEARLLPASVGSAAAAAGASGTRLGPASGEGFSPSGPNRTAAPDLSRAPGPAPVSTLAHRLLHPSCGSSGVSSSVSDISSLSLTNTDPEDSQDNDDQDQEDTDSTDGSASGAGGRGRGRGRGGGAAAAAAALAPSFPGASAPSRRWIPSPGLFARLGPRLRSLRLVGCDLRGGGALAALVGALPGLTSLSLQGRLGLTHADLAALSGLGQLRDLSLSRVELLYNPADPDDCPVALMQELYDALRQLPYFESLRFDLDAGGTGSLHGAYLLPLYEGPLERLRALSLATVSVDSDYTFHMLAQLSYLTSLTLSYTTFPVALESNDMTLLAPLRELRRFQMHSAPSERDHFIALSGPVVAVLAGAWPHLSQLHFTGKIIPDSRCPSHPGSSGPFRASLAAWRSLRDVSLTVAPNSSNANRHGNCFHVHPSSSATTTPTLTTSQGPCPRRTLPPRTDPFATAADAAWLPYLHDDDGWSPKMYVEDGDGCDDGCGYGYADIDDDDSAFGGCSGPLDLGIGGCLPPGLTSLSLAGVRLRAAELVHLATALTGLTSLQVLHCGLTPEHLLLPEMGVKKLQVLVLNDNRPWYACRSAATAAVGPPAPSAPSGPPPAAATITHQPTSTPNDGLRQPGASLPATACASCGSLGDPGSLPTTSSCSCCCCPDIWASRHCLAAARSQRPAPHPLPLPHAVAGRPREATAAARELRPPGCPALPQAAARVPPRDGREALGVAKDGGAGGAGPLRGRWSSSSEGDEDVVEDDPSEQAGREEAEAGPQRRGQAITTGERAMPKAVSSGDTHRKGGTINCSAGRSSGRQGNHYGAGNTQVMRTVAPAAACTAPEGPPPEDSGRYLGVCRPGGGAPLSQPCLCWRRRLVHRGLAALASLPSLEFLLLGLPEDGPTAAEALESLTALTGLKCLTLQANGADDEVGDAKDAEDTEEEATLPATAGARSARMVGVRGVAGVGCGRGGWEGVAARLGGMTKLRGLNVTGPGPGSDVAMGVQEAARRLPYLTQC